MARRITSVFLSVFVPAFALATASQVHAQAVGDPVPDTFTCLFVPGPVSATFESHKAANASGGQLLHVYRGVFNGFAIRLPAPALEQLMARTPLISDCYQSYYVGLPQDAAGSTGRTAARPGGGGGGGSSTEIAPWDIDRVGTGTPNGRKAWVVDTGIELNNADLVVDKINSKSFLSTSSRRENASSPEDLNGHGTHVAGTIAAIKGNRIGIYGVAAGATVVSVRVLDSRGVAPDTDVLAGLQYVYEKAANFDVVNLSLTAGSGSTVLNTAVVNLGARSVFVVMAAGNSATNVDSSAVSPGNQNGTGLYTVSASDKTGKLAYFSNYGVSVDYAEPGVGIVSLARGGGTTTKDGTSMAAPHLSGILLVTGGAIGDGGKIGADKDGAPDTIGVLP